MAPRHGLRRRLQREYTEVGDLPTLVVTSNWHDDSVTSDGCPPTGCVAANVRDGSIEPISRWSCKAGEASDNDGDCTLAFDLGQPEFMATIRIAFHQGDERGFGFVLYGDQNDTNVAGEGGAWIYTSKRNSGLQTFPVWSNIAYQVFSLTHFASDVGSEWIGITEVEMFVPADGIAHRAPATPSPTPSPTITTVAPIAMNFGHTPTGPPPTPSPTCAALETPAPLSPVPWAPKTSRSSSSTSSSSLSSSARDAVLRETSAVSDNITTAISVTITTVVLAILSIVVIVLAGISASKRRKRILDSAHEAASSFSSPLEMVPSSRRGVTSFFGTPWQPTPTRNERLSSRELSPLGAVANATRNGADMSENRTNNQNCRTWVLNDNYSTHVRSDGRCRSMPAGTLSLHRPATSSPYTQR